MPSDEIDHAPWSEVGQLLHNFLTEGREGKSL